MRGSLWSVVVVCVMLSLGLVAAGNVYDPATASQQTLDIAALFQPVGAVIGLSGLLVGTGAFLNWFSGGGF